MLLDTKWQYMRESNNIVDNVVKHFSQNGFDAEHRRAVHEGLTYPCRQCDHQATTKRSLAEH